MLNEIIGNQDCLLLLIVCSQDIFFLNRGIFIVFFNVLYSTLLHLPPLSSTVSEYAEIEPRTVATFALADRRSNNSSTSHPETVVENLKNLWL